MRGSGLGYVALCAASLSLAVACSPGERGDGADIPAVTAPPSTVAPSAGMSNPPAPALPTSPACGLLTSEEAERALGAAVDRPFGTKSRFYGAAGIDMDIDMCTWQRTVNGQPAGTVQVNVDTADRPEDAVQEYQAFVAQLKKNTAPTAILVPVIGLGAQAVLLPEWLVAQKGREVVAVTTTPPQGATESDPEELRRLARLVTERLGWS